MSTASHQHIPVLLAEVLDALVPADGATYVDGTFGRGGYSKAILAACDTCDVIGIDHDPDAISAGTQLEKQYPRRFRIVAGKFSDMESIAKSLGLNEVNGVALDVGVSSVQLDDGARGFSFQKDAPLDMRMSKSGMTAADVVNEYPEEELSDIFYQYGEERAARRLAREIVRRRDGAPIKTTLELAGLVEETIGRKHSKRKIHPATKTFQALRIFVNDEIHELANGLAAAERILAEDACLAVVSFHSLEDRLVKRFLAIRSGQNSSVSRHQPPLQNQREPSFVLRRRSAIKPHADEISKNSRARSARLRVAYRTQAKPFDLNLDELGISNLPTKRAV